MAGGPAVITDHEARDVHGLEVREGETCKASKIGVVPARVRGADEPSAVSVVGQDDSIVSECGDDNGRLWICRSTRGSRDGRLESIDLASRSGHGAACWWRRLRNLPFEGNRSPSRSRATPHARRLDRKSVV